MVWIKRLCVLSLCLAWLLTCEPAYGRAGGGGGFSGGGGGFSSGSTSYGGLGGSSHYDGGSGRAPGLIDVLIVVGILAVLAIPYGLSLALRSIQGPSQREQTKPTHYRASRKEHLDTFKMIHANDPAFDGAAFIRRFAKAFTRIQGAWSNQNLQPIQHFVSDGIYERFTLQIQEQKDMGYRDHMENIRIESALLAEASTSGEYEVLTVQVTASAIDYRVSIKSGKFLSGSPTPESFTEFWSFVRRKGAQTKSSKLGLIEGKCPNCGGALRINMVQQCPSCRGLLRSGEYDWVLSEITQGCVWRPRDLAQTLIAERYRQRHDLGFNIQHLEDRASVIFWRNAMANRLDDNRPLMKVATTQCCENWGRHRKTRVIDGGRRYHGGCAVGSIELVGIVEEKEHHYALVDVRWSANEHSVDPKGTVTDLGAWSRYKSLYLLMRNQGVESKIGRVIDSAHCAKCGAPDSDIASHACDFCQTILNDGSQDWVLYECCDLDSASAKAWLHRSMQQQPNQGRDSQSGQQSTLEPSYADLLAWTTNIFAADNKFNEREKEFILHLANKQGMSRTVLVDLINRARNGLLDTPGPLTPASKRAWVGMLVDVALLDNKVEPDERRLLCNVGEQVGLDASQIDLLIDKHKSKRNRDATFLDTLNEA